MPALPYESHLKSASLHHLTSGGAEREIPRWALTARLPFQGVLIAWAWWHTRL